MPQSHGPVLPMQLRKLPMHVPFPTLSQLIRERVVCIPYAYTRGNECKTLLLLEMSSSDFPLCVRIYMYSANSLLLPKRTMTLYVYKDCIILYAESRVTFQWTRGCTIGVSGPALGVYNIM